MSTRTTDLNEQKFKTSIVIPGLERRGFDVQAHEDRDDIGIPDLSFGYKKVDGWIELKVLRARKKEFVINNFTEQQKEWLIRRGSRGQGACFLMIGILSENVIVTLNWMHIKHYMNASWQEAESVFLTNSEPDVALKTFREVIESGRFNVS